MSEYRCLCCGYKTLDSRGEYEICAVCFWEDEICVDYNNKDLPSLHDKGNPILEKLMDVRSGANHGLTLRQGRENYLSFGACEITMLEHVRPPKEGEK